MKIHQLAAIAVLSLCTSVGAFAQAVAGLGAISGTVRDASGAAVPDATVVVANESKGIRRTLQTTEAGVFAAPSLTPAAGYLVSVTKQGFAKWEAKDFDVAVGQTVDFRVTLQVASTGTTVDVTAEAPLVEEAKNGVASTVGQVQLDNLPINGRRVDSYVLMTPAVTNDGEFGLISFRGIAMGNAFLTNGNDTTNSFYNENAGRTRIGSQISQDAVQEFQVLSNGFSAEFGRAMGGVVNTVTRSGTNNVHGTAYWYFRNRTLEAADRYANGMKGPEWRHTAGFSLGGPIKKDKLFYFVNFDYTKRNFPGLNRITSNTLVNSAGDLICNTTGNGAATPAQCAAASAFVRKQMDVLVPRSYTQPIGLAKIDWRPSERNSFTFDLNAMHWRSPHGIQTQTVLTSGAMIGDNGNSTVETRFGKAAWTFIPTTSSVNELRFGWFKDRLSDPGASDLWPTETGPLYLSVGGATVGASRGYPRTYPSENRFQLVDNFSVIKGAHSIRFGVDWQTTNDWMNQLYNGSGAYSYSNLTNFALDFNGGAFGNVGTGHYTSFTQTLGNPIHEIRTSDINFYFQDTWKLAPKLTLGYGLRYEKSFLPQPTITNPDYPATGRVNSPDKNFAPRINLSYAFDNKTVLRAGYGIFYARIHGNLLDTLWLGNGKYQTSVNYSPSQAGAPQLPNILASANAASGIQLNLADPNFRAPYTQQGTVALERQIGRDWGVTASYIWSRGIGLFTQRDLNLGAPQTNVTYIIQDASNANVGTYTTPVYTYSGRPDPRYGKILQIENGGQSWYNALAIQVQKRFSHSFQGQLNYTWSHAIDDANQQGASWNISNTYNNATNNGDWKLDKGSSTLDQRHRLSINWVWEPKFVNSEKAYAKYLVNGWQLSAVTTLASAHPVSATMNSVSTSNNGVFQGIQLAYSTLNGSGGWNRVPWLPVSSLNVDQIYQVDARLTRKFPIGERMSLNLGFEGFNVFNTIHNTGILTTSYSVSSVGGVGVIRPLANVGVGSASQGFPDGTNARRLQANMRFTF